MCELALTKAQSEKRKVKSESAKRKRVLTPLKWPSAGLYSRFGGRQPRQNVDKPEEYSPPAKVLESSWKKIVFKSWCHMRYSRQRATILYSRPR